MLCAIRCRVWFFCGGIIAFMTLECSTGFKCAVPFQSFIPLCTTAVYTIFLLRAFFSACYVALCLMQHIRVDTMFVDLMCRCCIIICCCQLLRIKWSVALLFCGPTDSLAFVIVPSRHHKYCPLLVFINLSSPTLVRKNVAVCLQ